MLNLTTKTYTYTDHTLSINWRQDEDDDYKGSYVLTFFQAQTHLIMLYNFSRL